MREIGQERSVGKVLTSRRNRIYEACPEVSFENVEADSSRAIKKKTDRTFKPLPFRTPDNAALHGDESTVVSTKKRPNHLFQPNLLFDAKVGEILARYESPP